MSPECFAERSNSGAGQPVGGQQSVQTGEGRIIIAYIAIGVLQMIAFIGVVYGYMYPATHVAHAIAACEILLGLFFSATITGLNFSRFARPRVGVAFSRCAVMGTYEGRRALMLRVVSLRPQPLADANAQAAWLETCHHPDGSMFRRLSPLTLVRDRNPMFSLSWTLVHLIEPDSPLLATLESDGGSC